MVAAVRRGADGEADDVIVLRSTTFRLTQVNTGMAMGPTLKPILSRNARCTPSERAIHESHEAF